MKISNLIYMLVFSIISFFSLLISVKFYFESIFIFFNTSYFICYTIIFIIFSSSISYFIFSLNKLIWKYPARQDLLKIILFAISSVFLFYFFNFLINRLEPFPRSIFLIHILVDMIFVIIFIYNKGIKDLVISIFIKNNIENISVIIGISNNVINLIKINESLNLFKFNLILDVSDNYKNKRLRSIQVDRFLNNNIENQLGGFQNILIDPNIIDDELLAKITDLCLRKNIKIINISKILSGFSENPNQNQIGIENLIPKLKIDDYKKYLLQYSSNTILITGSCGSIGSEIVKKLSEAQDVFLVCIDINEEKMMELDLYFKFKGFSNYSLELCNLSDLNVIDEILIKYKPIYCFHAAAMKHVPFVETSPNVAIQVNILHTINLCKLCFKNNVQKFNFISTDKAVNPNNIMGLTKRVAEIYLMNLKKDNPHFDIRIIRFGNVINSSGSVIPIFKRNIEYRQKLTVTHPDIKRFFMSISDAVKLVLISNTMTTKHDNKDLSVFILDMGEQIKILDLAKKFLIINNLSLDNLDDNFTGLRPGEKLFEELNYNFETVLKTSISNLNAIEYDKKTKFVQNMQIDKFLEEYNLETNQIKKNLTNLIATN